MKNIFLFFFLILLFGCKKYPEGGYRDIYVYDEWDVEYFSINGFDSTSYLKNQPFYGKYFFSNEKEGSNDLFVYKNSTSSTNYNGDGYWMFLNHRGSVYVHFNNYSGPSLGAYRAKDVVWEIRRLKHHQLWLKTVYNGKEFFVKFKPA